MVNQPNRGPGMWMELGGPGMSMRQEMKLSPPIAESSDKAKVLAPRKENRSDISNDILRLFEGFIASESHERPYSDKEFVDYCEGLGYHIKRREVAWLRHGIQIKPSYERQ